MRGSTQLKPNSREAHYALAGFGFTLAVEDPAAIDQFDRCFDAFLAPDFDGPKTSFALRRSRTGCVLYRDGEGFGVLPSTAAAVEYLQWFVTQCALDSLKGVIALHGAGVVLDGRAALLIGPSGAGKSALTAELLRMGLEFLTDEAILVEPADGSLHAFPRGIGLVTAARASGQVIDMTNWPQSEYSTGCQKHYYPARMFGAKIARGTVRPGAVILLREMGKRTSLQTLGRAEAIPALASAIFGAISPAETLPALIRLVEEGEVYTLRAGEPRLAARAVYRLLVSIGKD